MLKDALSIAVTVLACLLTYKAAIRGARATSQQASIAAQVADDNRARQLREDLESANRELSKLRRELAVLTREAESAVADLMHVQRMIWRDGMTIPRLREYLGPPPPPPNGRAAVPR